MLCYVQGRVLCSCCLVDGVFWPSSFDGYLPPSRPCGCPRLSTLLMRPNLRRAMALVTEC